jgi:nucleotide-binding universal stress UspA family protein
VYHKILVGYDGSEAAKKAFDAACDLAVQHGAELFVLTVSRPPEIADDVETQAVISRTRGTITDACSRS